MKCTVIYDPRWTTDKKPFLVKPEANCFSHCRKSAKALENLMQSSQEVELSPRSQEKMEGYAALRNSHINSVKVTPRDY